MSTPKDFSAQVPLGTYSADTPNIIVDGHGRLHYVTPAEAEHYRNGGFLNNVAKAAPYGVMAGMAYGAVAPALGIGAAGVPTTINAAGLPVNMTAAATAGVLPTAATTAAAAATAAKSGGALATIKKLFLDGDSRAIPALAALLPILASSRGGDSSGNTTPGANLPTTNPFANLDPSFAKNAADAYGMQKHRVEQTQPAFDALVSQAYGMTPTRYRGAAPEGVPASASEPASGAYVYNTPRFG